MTKKTAKNKIREATVGARKRYNSENVEFNGVNIEVRQLSIADRRDYLDKTIQSLQVVMFLEQMKRFLMKRTTALLQIALLEVLPTFAGRLFNV
jgi:hypothetical protein